MTTIMRRKKSTRIEESGVKVRLYRKRGVYWADVRLKGRPRYRCSLKTADRETAEASASALGKEIAKQQLVGVSPATVTLGQLFTAYAANKGATLDGQWKRSTKTKARLFEAAWGPGFMVSTICQTQVDAYCHARRAGKVAGKARAAAKAKGKALPPLRDGALDSDFRWLSSVFNWGRKHKLSSGQRLLDQNPLADVQWPREKNVRRPIASQPRYVATLAKADAVDPEGRLRLMLTLARETGRRENAILQLRASDVLLSSKAVIRALAVAGMDERLAGHMPHGAIRWNAETDKQKVLHITPISHDAKAAIEAYLQRNPRLGDVPLFPGQFPDRPLSRAVITRWLAEAEKAAGLPKLVGGCWHPYRRLWASERRHLADVDVARAGGWKSTKTLEIYQQSDPEAVYKVVMNGRTGTSA